jgi:hypothetical protein
MRAAQPKSMRDQALREGNQIVLLGFRSRCAKPAECTQSSFSAMCTIICEQHGMGGSHRQSTQKPASTCKEALNKHLDCIQCLETSKQMLDGGAVE